MALGLGFGLSGFRPYVPVVDLRDFLEFSDISVLRQKPEYALAQRREIVLARDHFELVPLEIKLPENFEFDAFGIN
jgi:hypothetical protein